MKVNLYVDEVIGFKKKYICLDHDFKETWNFDFFRKFEFLIESAELFHTCFFVEIYLMSYFKNNKLHLKCPS